MGKRSVLPYNLTKVFLVPQGQIKKYGRPDGNQKINSLPFVGTLLFAVCLLEKHLVVLFKTRNVW